MKTFYLGFDTVARVAHVSEASGNIPSGTLGMGTFVLPEDTEDDLGYARNGNSTIFHRVRDKLYAIGEQNMQAVAIQIL